MTFNLPESLFNDTHGNNLSAISQSALASLQRQVQSLSLSDPSKRDVEDLVRKVISAHLIQLPILDEPKLKIDSEIGVLETRVGNIPVTRMKFQIPFQGTQEVFYFRPPNYDYSGEPRAFVNANNIVIVIDYQESENRDLKAEFERLMEKIKSNLIQLSAGISSHNERLESYARETIGTLIQKIEVAEQAAAQLKRELSGE
jgi:hypothetical protein